MANSRTLATRDVALAALLGVIGSDFGAEVEMLPGSANFGSDFDEPDFDPSLDGDIYGTLANSESYDGGFTDIGSDFGVDFGWEFGADAVAPPPPPAAHPALAAHPAMHPAIHRMPPQAQAILKQHAMKQAHRAKRAMLLEPNKYSDLKVERYTFSVNATITALGTPGALLGTNSPDVNFRPQRVTSNVVSPAMVTISDARVANVSFTVGGQLDAWLWNANAVGQHLDVPTLTPANKATFSGNYTGLVPSPLSGTGSYPFALSFTGPASIVA